MSTVRQLNAEFSRRFSLVTSTQFLVLKGAGSSTGASSSSGLNAATAGSFTTAASTANLLRLPGNAPAMVNTGHIGSLSTSSIMLPNRTASPNPLLNCHRLKVTFKDEPGEGSGVARSFITAFSLAVLSGDKLPNLAPLLQHQQQPIQQTPVSVSSSYAAMGTCTYSSHLMEF